MITCAFSIISGTGLHGFGVLLTDSIQLLKRLYHLMTVQYGTMHCPFATDNSEQDIIWNEYPRKKRRNCGFCGKNYNKVLPDRTLFSALEVPRLFCCCWTKLSIFFDSSNPSWTKWKYVKSKLKTYRKSTRIYCLLYHYIFVTPIIKVWTLRGINVYVFSNLKWSVLTRNR